MFPVPLQKLWGWAMSHGHERGFAPTVHAMAPHPSLPPVSLAPVSLLAQGDKP